MVDETDKKKAPGIISRAIMAGALVTGGCDSSAPMPQDAPTETVPQSVPNGSPRTVSSKELYQLAFSANILETYVIVDDQRIRLIGPSDQDNRQWDALVKAKRSFQKVELEFVDPTGMLETCKGAIAVSAPYRNTKHLPQLITNESLVPNLLAMAQQCEKDHPTATLPQEALPSETVDPRTITSNERAHNGRIERNGHELNV